MALTLVTAKSIADHLLGDSLWTPPPALWLGLLLGNPTPAGLVTDEVPASGTGYGRADVTGIWSAADALTGVSINTSTVNIGPATADWGTIRYAAIFDQQVGGTMLFYAAFSEAETINNEGQFQRVPGQMQIRFF